MPLSAVEAKALARELVGREREIPNKGRRQAIRNAIDLELGHVIACEKKDA
jgi:hypothetical protein